MIKALIFDYGGTLDTGGNHWEHVLWHAYQRCGVPVSEQLFRDAYVHTERLLGSKNIIQPDFTFRQTLEAKITLQMQFLELRDNSYVPALFEDVYALTQQHTAHSVEVLTRLKSRYVLMLVSNFYGNLPVVLREFGFDGLFLKVVESAAVGIRKPDPRIFQLAIESLGLCPDEVAVIGDSIKNDILPAQHLGCQTVWFKGEQWTDTPSYQTASERIITDLCQLSDIFNQLRA